MSNRYYDNEAQAKSDIAVILKPHFPVANIFVADREPINIGMRAVVFAVRVKKDDEKCESAINAFYQNQIGSTGEKLEWIGTKMDFMNTIEEEYIMVRAVIENG